MGPAEWPTKCISSGCKAACTDHNLIFCIAKLFKRSLICKDVQLYQVRLVRQCNSVINIITITVSQHHSYFNILMYLGQITLLGQVKKIGQKWTGISLNFSSESQKLLVEKLTCQFYFQNKVYLTIVRYFWLISSASIRAIQGMEFQGQASKIR